MTRIFEKERHRSDGMQSTYRRGAVKSLLVDEGGAVDGELERGMLIVQ